MHFRYDSIVTAWRDAFPDARFVARNYDDVSRAGGSIADFFDQASIPFAPARAETGIRSNPSIPYAMAEILRRANAALGSEASAVRDYLSAAKDRIATRSNTEVELFGAAHREALCDAFEPVHKALCDQLGVPTFFADIDKARICNPVPELEAAREALAALKQDVTSLPAEDPARSFISDLTLPAD